MLPPLEDFLSGKIKTLGWGVLDWCSQWLSNPDNNGGVKGEQWEFKPDQVHFILAFYAIDREGRWVYRRAYRERAKGTGKSPMVAAIACAEFLGPVRFSHYDERGNPVGKENVDSLVWLAAVSQDGCKHTYRYIMAMLDGPVRWAYRLDIGETRILIKGSSERRIETITASYRAHEGPKPSFAICEETQNWVPSEKGDYLHDVIRRGLGKVNGRSVEVTNAPVPGQNSVAEVTHRFNESIREGKSLADGLLFDTFSLSVQDIYDPEQAMPALQEMYRDAHWIDQKTIFAEICDPATREVDARRFYFNEMVSPTEMWIQDAVWQSAFREDIKLRKSDQISLGFRVKKNCCAIVATRLDDLAVFLVDFWERPKDAGREWEVPYTKIDAKVRQILDKYEVYNVVASPENFQDIVGRWSIDYEGEVEVEELWASRSRQKMHDAIELFETAVRDQRLIHDGNPDLTRHVKNCFLDEVNQFRLIRQVTSSTDRYIVAAEAAVLSVYAALEAIEDGALKEGPSGYIWTF